MKNFSAKLACKQQTSSKTQSSPANQQLDLLSLPQYVNTQTTVVLQSIDD
jgi:hypothetical protein